MPLCICNIISFLHCVLERIEVNYSAFSVSLNNTDALKSIIFSTELFLKTLHNICAIYAISFPKLKQGTSTKVFRFVAEKPTAYTDVSHDVHVVSDVNVFS